jgi:tetratricopeptide (TPR) repeat protein
VSQQFSWILRLPLLGFGVVMPLALLGLALSAGQWRRLVPVYALLAVYVATSVLFFVLSRYRNPIVPVLLVFAAYATIWLLDQLRQRRWAPLSIALVALVPATAVANWKIAEDDLSVAYYNLGNKYRTLGEYELAVAQYDRSLEINRSYISAHNNLALALEGSARPRAEAVRAWQTVRAMGEQRGLARYVEIADRHLAALAE